MKGKAALAPSAVEGTIDHEILGIHLVHPGEGQLAWDVGFLASGLLMVAVGWSVVRAGREDSAPRGSLVSIAPVACSRSCAHTGAPNSTLMRNFSPSRPVPYP